MAFDYRAAASLTFTSNGAALFDRLTKASQALANAGEKLDSVLAKLNSSLAALDETVAGAVAGQRDLAAAFRDTAAAASAAGAASRGASAGFASASRGGVARGAASSARLATVASRSALPAALATQFALPSGERIPIARPIPGSGGSVPVGGGGAGAAGFAAGAAGGIPGLVTHAAKIGLEIGVGTAIDGIYEATKLQRALIGIKNATGASDSQIAALRQKAYDTGDQTGTSAVKTADMFAVMARSSGGVFTDKAGGFDMGGFMQIAPTMAKIAQIQNLTRGVSLDSAAQTVMQLAHLFHTYSGASFNQVGDQLTRLSEMMPDSLQVALRQMTYFAPQFKALGIKDNDTIATMALLDRLGYGRGKGGTNMADLIGASLGGLQMTQHAQAGKDALLRKFGVVDASGKSKFFTDKGADLTGFLEQLSRYATSPGQGRVETVQQFKSAFGVQGGRIADLAMDPQFVQQLDKIETVMKNPNISLDEQWTRYFGSAGTQMHRAFSNFQSDMTKLGWLALPAVTKSAKDLGDALHYAQTWLHEHQALERQVSDYALGMVKNVESFLTSHKGDIAAMGPPLLLMWHGIERTTKVVETLAGYFLDLYGAISKVLNPIITLIDKLDGSADKLIKRAIDGVLHPAAPLPYRGHPATTGGVDLGVPAHAAAGWLGDRVGDIGHWFNAQRAANSRYHRTQTRATGHTVLTIHVDARGTHDPKAVKAAAKAGVRDGLSDPRSTLALAGAGIRTHALLPNAVSVQGV